MSIDFNQLREFAKAISQTEITEFILKTEGIELILRKGSAMTSVVSTVTPVAPPPPPADTPKPSTTVQVVETPVSTGIDKKWTPITSPVVGTFYSASAPGEPLFVQVGDGIVVGQVVCIVEAMKVMNEIESEVSGMVMKVVVENGQPVEYGQTLMWINPD